MAVLRNGLFDSKNQQELLLAVLQDGSDSGDTNPAEQKTKKSLEEKRWHHVND